MRRRPIDKLWQAYRKHAVHPDAPAGQVHSLRLAFYGGAASLFGTMVGELGPQEDVEDADLTLLDDIQAEIAAFVSDENRKDAKA